MDDVDDEGVVVCASATPDVTTPRIAAATRADRTNDIVVGSLMRFSEDEAEIARIHGVEEETRPSRLCCVELPKRLMAVR